VTTLRRAVYLRDLLLGLVARDIKLLYRRSVFGVAWALLFPLAQLLVFVFVFRVVMPIDIPDYSLFLFTGILVWGWFQSSVFVASGSIVANRDLIRQPGFPAAVLPAVTVTTHLIHFLLAFGILLPGLLFANAPLSPAMLALPLVVAIQFVLISSVAYLVAALHVAFRDTQNIIGVLLLLGFYLTPVFYDTSMIPDDYRTLYSLNPLVPLLDAYRSILMRGALPPLAPLAMVAIASTAALIASVGLFRRTSCRFAEEL
jgi:lipopolysaccharide transport system permease protein